MPDPFLEWPFSAHHHHTTSTPTPSATISHLYHGGHVTLPTATTTTISTTHTWYDASWMTPCTWALYLYCALSLVVIFILSAKGMIDKKLNVRIPDRSDQTVDRSVFATLPLPSPFPSYHILHHTPR